MATRIPRLAVLASLLAVPLLACGPSAAPPRTTAGGSSLRVVAPPALGSAGTFAVLAATAVTCTDSTILGNVGVSPGTALTQTSCPITGTINAGDATAAQAQTDFSMAYDALAALACDQTLTTLDGQSLAPGVYCFDAAVTSTGGVLVLDGPSTGTWVFKVGTLGTGALTGTNFSVLTPAGTPPACGSVFWWVAEAATLTDSQFVGSILAGAAVTLTRGTFAGDAYSKAAVTITGNTVTGCALGGGPGGPGDCTGDDDDRCECREDDSDDDDDRSSSKRKGNGHDSRCGGQDDDDDDHDDDDDDDDDHDDDDDDDDDRGRGGRGRHHHKR